MKITSDMNRPGFRNPKDGTEKLIVLIALLQERPRTESALAEILDNNERRVHRDIKSISALYSVSTNQYNQKFIPQ